jgi:dihydroneopterin aldolase
MDRIRIEKLRLPCIIGCYPAERQQAQTLLLTLTLHGDIRRAAASDQLADAMDYDALAQQLRSLAAKKQRHLLEALAEDIAAHCLAACAVRAVSVELRKPDVPAAADAAVVCITRRRPHSSKEKSS